MIKKTKESHARIEIRMSAQEKEQIQSKAEKCGLSTTEYVKQRALGYEPRAVPPDALFRFLEKLSSLENKTASPELDAEISHLLKEITAAFLLPGKEGKKKWLLQDSGLSVEI